MRNTPQTYGLSGVRGRRIKVSSASMSLPAPTLQTSSTFV